MPVNNDGEKYLQVFLEEMKDKGNLSGILYAYRDGNLIIDSLNEKLDAKNFAAMCASVLASAETLKTMIRNQEFIKITAELKNINILLMGCDDKTYIALLFDNEANIDPLLNNIDYYLKKINELYRIGK
ncbi:MAG: roadblock/LC7 domain-containing protein [Promethearchaeia archaeon]